MHEAARDVAAAVSGLCFRPMRSSDLGDIIEIERASFTFPWSKSFFLQELRVASARSLLAVLDGKPVGYIIYWVVSDEIDIHNLAVHPDFRRQGIGKALLEGVMDQARRQDLARVTLEVRKSNDAAQKLYQSMGFAAIGLRRGYYSDDGEDAVVMALDLHR